MNITKGVKAKAQKVVLYGPEGVGKSSLAAQFPNPLFIDTEGSTDNMDVARLDAPSSFTMIMNQINFIIANPTVCQTLVIDTADWAETLCKRQLMAERGWQNIDTSDYGVRYVALSDEWGKMLNRLQDLIDVGVNVVLTAHAQLKKFEQPDEMGSYDRYELKLERRCSAITKEWADMILFLNYKTYVIEDDKTKTKKAQGGQRVIYTEHHPAWDAKNRHGLPPILNLEYASIAHIFNKVPTQPQSPTNQTQQPSQPQVTQEPVITENEEPVIASQAQPESQSQQASQDAIPKGLNDLMTQNNVTDSDIRLAVSQKGYYPEDMPISSYDPQFIEGVLIAAWPQVFQMIQDNKNIPF